MLNTELKNDIWDVVHMYARAYNPDNMGDNARMQNKDSRQMFITFLTALGTLLPKDDFTKVFLDELHSRPPNGMQLTNRVMLLQWTFNFHHRVSSRAGYNDITKDYSMFRRRYDAFKKEDWARPTWRLLHVLPVFYPSIYDEYKTSVFIKLVTALQYILPCMECRSHLVANLKSLPLTVCNFQSNEDLFKWTYFLHERVNMQLGKDGMSYSNAKALYSIY